MTAIFSRKRILERMVVRGKVDREQGVIYDVQLLGPKSKNGRRYTARAMQEAVGKYEGARIYVDHPDDMGTDRKWDAWAGVVENARFSGGTIRGDIRLRKKSPKFEELIEAAEEFSEFFGMSHVADGQTRTEGGEEVVDEIREVFSVDIVQVPATANGLRESVDGDGGGDPVKVLLSLLTMLVKQLSDGTAKKPAAKKKKPAGDAGGSPVDDLGIPTHSESYGWATNRWRSVELTEADQLRNFANRLR